MTTVGPRLLAGVTDISAVAELLARCEAHDQLGERTTIDELTDDFVTPIPDWHRDVVVWEKEEQLVSLAAVFVPVNRTPDSNADGFITVDPTMRDDSITDAAIAWCLASARAELGAGASLQLFAKSAAAWRIDAYTRNGFVETRRYFRMQRELTERPEPAVLPAGYAIRTVSNHADAQAWVDAYNESFVDHWDHVPRTLAARLDEFTKPSYRQDLDLIAVAPSGVVAGFAWCDLRDLEAHGVEWWVHLLGVRRAHRRKGIAQALLIESLQRLYDIGARTVHLTVDSQSPTGATGLYDRNGFTTETIEIAFSHELG